MAEQGVARAQLAPRLLLPAVERQIMLVHRRHRRLAPVVQRVWDLVRGVAHARAAVPDAAAPRARARGQA